jgi:hypothetical protein
MKTVEEMRMLIADCVRTHGDKLERYRSISSGPYWPVLRRYAKMVNGAGELVSYIDELVELIDEMDNAIPELEACRKTLHALRDAGDEMAEYLSSTGYTEANSSHLIAAWRKAQGT